MVQFFVLSFCDLHWKHLKRQIFFCKSNPFSFYPFKLYTLIKRLLFYPRVFLWKKAPKCQNHELDWCDQTSGSDRIEQRQGRMDQRLEDCRLALRRLHGRRVFDSSRLFHQEVHEQFNSRIPAMSFAQTFDLRVRRRGEELRLHHCRLLPPGQNGETRTKPRHVALCRHRIQLRFQLF